MLHYDIHKLHTHAPWLVFIHGAGGSSKTWSYQVGALKGRYNLLLMDLRDHGMSKNITPTTDNYSFSLITEDIKTVLDHENIAQAYFVTLSFGSVILQDFCMQHEDMVAGMVIAGGIFNGNFAIRSFVHLARFMNLFLSYPTMYRLFSYLLMPYDRNQKARRIYQIQAAKLTPEEYLKWVGLYSEFFRLLRRFSTYQLPVKTLVVMGQDDYIFLQAAKNFASNQTNATLKIVNDAGHIVNIDSADEFNTILVNFLEHIQQEHQCP